jgi:hypothetical protein
MPHEVQAEAKPLGYNTLEIQSDRLAFPPQRGWCEPNTELLRTEDTPPTGSPPII